MRARLHKDLRGYSDKMNFKLYLIIDYSNEFRYFFLQFSEKYVTSELCIKNWLEIEVKRDVTFLLQTGVTVVVQRLAPWG